MEKIKFLWLCEDGRIQITLEDGRSLVSREAIQWDEQEKADTDKTCPSCGFQMIESAETCPECNQFMRRR